MDSLELWGGYECTVNRVGDDWFDQTLRSGHEYRLDDLRLFSDLGIGSLRYPALWERISPNHPEERDFVWTDARLAEIRRLGMNPIVTLCHHGSGPHYTSLIDAGFASGLARHAAAVAARYPWVRDWTPVNEPLTTARFSALYGYWYPHTKDERLFWTALLNEIDATRLAMREIRKVIPAARLIQTDDLGFCHATEPLRCEADFQNERRWIGWDLLCGMVLPGHALWERLVAFGLEDRLRAISDDPCPPDIIGINHYLASERLLDHRVERHPDRAVADRELGDCAGIPFVDVDAVRNWEEGVHGLPALIEQAWQRYGRTIAVTECHNGATREEQVRWFLEVWRGAEALRKRGVDLCAVTAWSLLGSHDWNRMVTRCLGHYETGVFDIRSGVPRPTLLAHVMKDLAAGRAISAPMIGGPGWWRRASRFIGGAPRAEQGYELELGSTRSGAPAALLIIDDGSDLAHLAIRACETRGLHYVRSADDGHDVLDAASAWAVLDARDPNGVCRTVGDGRRGRGYTRTPLAEGCARLKIPFAFISVEQARQNIVPAAGVLEIRTGGIFVPWDSMAEPVRMLDLLDAGEKLEIDATASWNGVYGPDVIDILLDLLLDGAEGAIELFPSERISKLELAGALAAVADAELDRIVARGKPASAPLFRWGGRATLLPPLDTMLERFVREARAARGSGELGVGRRDDDVRLEAAE
ncbi:MAG: putative b-glycosidase, Glycoside Hydrolase Family 1 [Alphaproteobacteria bacterium]|nr:putative b-glycosidase, Glycoside Hydrolase Family 1 [Alphaproteobacteria bacterium]